MPGLFLGGIFNQVFLGIPYFAWVLLALVLIAIIVQFLWWFFYVLKMKPYFGLFWSTLYKTGASFIFNENMHFELITDRSAKVIFNESITEAQLAEKDSTMAPSAIIGTVHTDLIFDPDRWTFPGSPARNIIDATTLEWNAHNKDDEIHTLVKFGRYLIDDKFEDAGIDVSGLKKWYTVPWARVDMMYPVKREESGWAGFLMQLASQIVDLQRESLNKYGWMIIILAGVVCFMLFLNHVLTYHPAPMM
jgi:hypothetical protein